MPKSEVEHNARFDLIRYAQCWEDAEILLEALAIEPGQTCMAICSAGDNALAMLTKRPARVIALDLSQAQLYCLELRVAAYRCLTHPELLQLMGSVDSRARRNLFEKCQSQLSEACQVFWETRMDAVERYGIGGVGKFERYFRLFKRFVLPLILSSRRRRELFEVRAFQERRTFYERYWNHWRWRLLLKIFFSQKMAGLLGRSPAFFKYVQGSLPEHIGRRVAYAMKTISPAENHYLQWIFFGRHLHADRGILPVALREENFKTIQDHLDHLEWRLQPAETFVDEFLAETPGTNEDSKFQGNIRGVDAFNLSNIFEYMSEQAYETLYAKLLSCASSGARFAYWNMMVPRHCPAGLKDRVTPCVETSKRLYARDKAFFYSDYVVERAR